jgi:hypothetical protein
MVYSVGVQHIAQKGTRNQGIGVHFADTQHIRFHMLHDGFKGRIFQAKAIVGCRAGTDVVSVIGKVVGHYPEGVEGLCFGREGKKQKKNLEQDSLLHPGKERQNGFGKKPGFRRLHENGIRSA